MIQYQALRDLSTPLAATLYNTYRAGEWLVVCSLWISTRLLCQTAIVLFPFQYVEI